MLYSVFCSSRRRHTRYIGDWGSDVCSPDLDPPVDPVGILDTGKRPELHARAAGRGAGELPRIGHDGERNNAEDPRLWRGSSQGRGGVALGLPAGGRGKLLPLDVVEVAPLLPLPEREHRSDRRQDRRDLEELPEEALLLLSRSFALVAQGDPPHRGPGWI